MKAVRWGVLGVSGHFILRILLPMKKSNEIELYALASRNEDKAKEIASKHGISKTFGSYDDLLSDPSIEAVFIPLPNNLHAEWIRKAADAGKHILCEKPLCLNAEEAADCIDYAKNKGVLIMEAFMYRFHPQWVRIRELVSVGEIGTVKTIHTLFTYNNKDANNIRNILSAGGGALMDIGCYAVSVPRFILNAEPSRVISLVDRDSNFKTDILSSGILDFDSARALFTVSTQLFPYQKVEIIGTNGNITIEIPFNTFVDVPAKVTIINGVAKREYLTEAKDQYALEFEAFSKAIREKKTTAIFQDDAVHNQKVLDALFKSEKSGNWEEV